MNDYSLTTDVELFELWHHGNNEAFEAIYDRYFNQLLNTSSKRIQSREDAVEIVQDVFVQLYLKRQQILHTSNLSGYLHTLLRNRIIDRFREQLYHEKGQNYLKQRHLAMSHEVPEAAMDGKILEEKITEIIEQLPGKCREVFVLSRVDNYSHLNIAEKLKISVSTVEKHISKALKIIREEVGKYQLNTIVVSCLFAASGI